MLPLKLPKIIRGKSQACLRGREKRGVQLPNLKWCQGHRVTVTQIRFSLEVWLLGDSALGEDGTVLLKAEIAQH